MEKIHGNPAFKTFFKLDLFYLTDNNSITNCTIATLKIFKGKDYD